MSPNRGYVDTALSKKLHNHPNVEMPKRNLCLGIKDRCTPGNYSTKDIRSFPVRNLLVHTEQVTCGKRGPVGAEDSLGAVLLGKR